MKVPKPRMLQKVMPILSLAVYHLPPTLFTGDKIRDVLADYEPEPATEALWDADWDDEDAPEEFKEKLKEELRKHSDAKP